MTTQCASNPGAEQLPDHVLILQQPLFSNNMLDLERGGIRNGMALIGMAVIENHASVRQGVEDFRAEQQGGDERIAASKPLGHDLDVWGDGLSLPGVHGARATHPTRHFVQDEEDVVLVTNCAGGG